MIPKLILPALIACDTAQNKDLQKTQETTPGSSNNYGDFSAFDTRDSDFKIYVRDGESLFLPKADLMSVTNSAQACSFIEEASSASDDDAICYWPGTIELRLTEDPTEEIIERLENQLNGKLVTYIGKSGNTWLLRFETQGEDDDWDSLWEKINELKNSGDWPGLMGSPANFGGIEFYTRNTDIELGAHEFNQAIPNDYANLGYVGIKEISSDLDPLSPSIRIGVIDQGICATTQPNQQAYCDSDSLTYAQARLQGFVEPNFFNTALGEIDPLYILDFPTVPELALIDIGLNGHGTKVAGVIGGQGLGTKEPSLINGTGKIRNGLLDGMADQIIIDSILLPHTSSLEFFTALGSTDFSLVLVTSAMELNQVANMSFGVNDDFLLNWDSLSQNEKDALELNREAVSDGIENTPNTLFVLASGNGGSRAEGIDVNEFNPEAVAKAFYGSIKKPNLVVAGAADPETGRVLESSTRGSDHILLNAPGDGGTSYAAPKVSAIGALLLAMPSVDTPEEAIAKMVSASGKNDGPTRALDGYTAILNAHMDAGGATTMGLLQAQKISYELASRLQDEPNITSNLYGIMNENGSWTFDRSQNLLTIKRITSISDLNNPASDGMTGPRYFVGYLETIQTFHVDIESASDFYDQDRDIQTLTFTPTGTWVSLLHNMSVYMEQIPFIETQNEYDSGPRSYDIDTTATYNVSGTPFVIPISQNSEVQNIPLEWMIEDFKMSVRLRSTLHLTKTLGTFDLRSLLPLSVSDPLPPEEDNYDDCFDGVCDDGEFTHDYHLSFAKDVTHDATIFFEGADTLCSSEIEYMANYSIEAVQSDGEMRHQRVLTADGVEEFREARSVIGALSPPSCEITGTVTTETITKMELIHNSVNPSCDDCEVETDYVQAVRRTEPTVEADQSFSYHWNAFSAEYFLSALEITAEQAPRGFHEDLATYKEGDLIHAATPSLGLEGTIDYRFMTAIGPGSHAWWDSYLDTEITVDATRD
jgi:hypothetical protein